MGRVDGVLRFGFMAAANPFARLKTRDLSCDLHDLAGN